MAIYTPGRGEKRRKEKDGEVGEGTMGRDRFDVKGQERESQCGEHE